MKLSWDEVSELLEAVATMDVARVEVQAGEVRIVVDRRAGNGTAGPEVRLEPAARAPATTQETSETVHATEPAQAPADAAPPQLDSTELEEWLARAAAGEATIVRAPMVGTFYRAKEPGARPFTEAGEAVGPGDVVGLIEVMKLFHSITAGAEGTVERILVGDGQVVEHDQPLIVVSHR